jgi:hypothetical protein
MNCEICDKHINTTFSRHMNFEEPICRQCKENLERKIHDENCNMCLFLVIILILILIINIIIKFFSN